jgi:hypothetical protein
MRISLFLLMAILLSGCESLPGYSYPTGATPVPELHSITLNQAIGVRAGYASVYIQHGKTRATNTAAEYYPHCILELRNPAPEARTVQPDTFTVTRTHRDRFMAFISGMMLASDGGDYNPVMSSTEFFLHSERQPEVFRLTCQQLDDPYRVHHLTVDEMQEALGGIMTLR